MTTSEELCKVKCWKCKRELQQEYDHNCCWCGSNIQEGMFENIPCPQCAVDISIHSEYGAKKCLLESLGNRTK